MTELALALFAAATDSHLVEAPRAGRYAAFCDRFDERAERERLAAAGFRFLARSDQGFPLLLRAIHDPPPGLFLRGVPEEELLSRPAVAVVGARACSPYGRQVARLLGRERVWPVFFGRRYGFHLLLARLWREAGCIGGTQRNLDPDRFDTDARQWGRFLPEQRQR